ncbi:Integral membrane protein dgcr2/IDD [Saguinus oedipus]|uniref:Integral membrane protein dgcr2/IDD n=1 Tax=Saguinus oedipus TaxID=9490 RepID=A0ABQ9WJ00_SAGOE|nr:Integral membrane protein dgcr2/IDD [Saguinus oedipus]
MSENDNVFCAQLQCFHFPTLRHHDLHSWHAESCYEKSSFLCKRMDALHQLTPCSQGLFAAL